MISRDGLELRSDSIMLRPYCEDDVNRLYEAARESTAEVSVWLPWCHSEYSIEESRTWVESRSEAWDDGLSYDFVIVDITSGLFLGGCGLNRIERENGNANLGYWVRTGRTRQGAATTATRLLARFGFKELALNRIEIIAAVGNMASQRVAEKAGALREGILRNRIVVHDEIHDAVVFSLVPEDIITGE